MVTTLNQILGLYNDRIVTKVILGFMVTMDLTDENKFSKVQVEKFLAEEMNTQIVNLNTLKHFRYQTHLIQFLFHYNQEYFHELQRPKNSTSESNVSFFNKNENQGMFIFVNENMPKSSYFSLNHSFPIV